MENLLKKKTLKDIDIKNKKVLVRVDYNVPINANGEITDAKTIIGVFYLNSSR